MVILSASTILDSFDKIVSQKTWGAYVILGILVVMVGFGIGMAIKTELILYLSLIAGIAIIISSFLMIIRQYERAVILRLGKYQKQVGPGIQTRIPFADNVLVVDIRERVR